MVCGQLYHTTTRVVLWTDPGGYDAYRVEPRFAPLDPAARKAAASTLTSRVTRFGLRQKGLTADEIEKVRGGGWDLPTLARVVDQFVIHFDAAGTSKRCFQILQDRRGLSVHFMLDLDGTIYQTLDAKESAWHATIANGRSIGVEVANIGAYPIDGPDPLAATYRPDPSGRSLSPAPIRLATPAGCCGPVVTKSLWERFRGRGSSNTTSRPSNTRRSRSSQPRSASSFPKIRPDYPRDEIGALVTHKLPDADYARYQGILGHYHVQTNKVDPGPAFQWEQFLKSTRSLLK